MLDRMFDLSKYSLQNMRIFGCRVFMLILGVGVVSAAISLAQDKLNCMAPIFLVLGTLGLVPLSFQRYSMNLGGTFLWGTCTIFAYFALILAVAFSLKLLVLVALCVFVFSLLITIYFQVLQKKKEHDKVFLYKSRVEKEA